MMSNPKGLKNIPAIRQKVAMFLRNICLQVITIHLFGFKVYEFEKNQILFHKYFVRMNIIHIFVEIIKKSTTMKNLIISITFILVSLVSLSQYVKPTLIKTTYVEATKIEQLVLKEVNSERAKYGLSQLAFCPKAKEMAKYHAIYLSHYGVELEHEESVDLKDFVELSYSQRVEKFLPGKYYVGECAQSESLTNWNNESDWDNKITKSIVRSWMNSPPHRAIILDREYRYFAVSILDVSQHLSNGNVPHCSDPVLVLYK
jgi:uncharacterized protein YkwD